VTGASKTKGWKSQRKITGGNADRCENKGVGKTGIQKLMKIWELKIDHFRGALRVEGGRRNETGTLSAEPWIGYYRIRYCLSSEKLKAMDRMSYDEGNTLKAN